MNNYEYMLLTELLKSIADKCTNEKNQELRRELDLHYEGKPPRPLSLFKNDILNIRNNYIAA